MKKNIFLILIACTILAFSANAQAESKAEVKVKVKVDVELKKDTFKVYGNCGMCERRIEGSLKDVEGVSLADWDNDIEQMTVSFDPAIISLDAIKQKIADVGYDSETHRAKKEIYDMLPGCCQYERPE